MKKQIQTNSRKITIIFAQPNYGLATPAYPIDAYADKETAKIHTEHLRKENKNCTYFTSTESSEVTEVGNTIYLVTSTSNNSTHCVRIFSKQKEARNYTLNQHTFDNNAHLHTNSLKIK